MKIVLCLLSLVVLSSAQAEEKAPSCDPGYTLSTARSSATFCEKPSELKYGKVYDAGRLMDLVCVKCESTGKRPK